MRIRLKISYDGTNYNGWQRQKGMQNNKIAIQNIIDDALSDIYKTEIKTIGASRTDAGVHALSQYAIYDIENSNLPPNKIYIILNQKLPEDIRVTESLVVSPDFHPRYNCVSKTYEYKVLNEQVQNPLTKNFMLLVKDDLDLQKMSSACEKFLGTHDFLGFSNKSEIEDTTRTIFECYVTKQGNEFTFTVSGDGFLYNMVRIMVGTILDIGMNKRDADTIDELFKTKDRKTGVSTIRGCGLVLKSVVFDEGVVS